MKKLLSILALFAFVATTATYAQADKAADAAPAVEKAVSTDGPMMVFDAKTIDYGEIEQNSEPLRVFTFTNTGNEPLIISNAKGSCGCTVPKWPKDPILPGEAGTIEVRYDTKRIGPFNKRVTLTTNESAPTHTLKIKGKVNAQPVQESVPASTGGFGNQ